MSRPHEPADRRGPGPGAQLAETARSTASTFLSLVLLRAELARLEAREAGGRLILTVVLGVAAGALLGWAYLFTAAAVVGIVAAQLERPWPYIALAAAGLHLLIACGLLLLVRNRLRSPLFQETLNQLRRDRECLAKTESANS